MGEQFGDLLDRDIVLSQPWRLRLTGRDHHGRQGRRDAAFPGIAQVFSPPLAGDFGKLHTSVPTQEVVGKSASIRRSISGRMSHIRQSAPGLLPLPLSPTTPSQRCGGSAHPGVACAQRACPISAEAAASSGAATIGWTCRSLSPGGDPISPSRSQGQHRQLGRRPPAEPQDGKVRLGPGLMYGRVGRCRGHRQSWPPATVSIRGTSLAKS